MPLKHDKKALRRSFWGALGRLVGVMMGAGAGSLLYQMIGSASTVSVGVAILLTGLGFAFIWFAEYEREVE